MRNVVKVLATIMLMVLGFTANALGKNHFDCSQYSKETDGVNHLVSYSTSPEIRCLQYNKKETNNILGHWDSANTDFYKLPSNFEPVKSDGRVYSEEDGLYNFIVKYGMDLGLAKIKSFLVDFGFTSPYKKIAYHMKHTPMEVIVERAKKFSYSKGVKEFLAKTSTLESR